MRIVQFVSAAFAASSLAAPALASAQDAAAMSGNHSVEVSYGDLDLETIEGRRALDRRLWSAAAAVCRAEQSSEPKMLLNARVCREVALERVEPQLALALSARSAQSSLASR